MLDADQLDLSALAYALQDRSDEHSWWFDPATGEVELWSEYSDHVGDEHPGDRDLVVVEPLGSDDAYEDMADFAASVPDPRIRGRLERALEGRGAFRRFKDELLEHPELRSAWFQLSDARMTRRAVLWLTERELIEPTTAERLLAANADPPPPAAVTERLRLAGDVAHDLGDRMGDRLQRVLLFGSSARGEDGPDSDLDLLVVVTEGNTWADRALIDDVLWRHTLQSGIVVSALPVHAHDLEPPRRPTLIRAMADAVAVR